MAFFRLIICRSYVIWIFFEIFLIDFRSVYSFHMRRIIYDTSSYIGGSHQGLFYGIQTLKQLFREHGYQIPSMIIENEPAFQNRGFMLDISRDRVPTMSTLKSLIDILAELKYNQFHLYTEHTFAYANHEIVWKDYSSLTSQDILELDNYCKERYIELVPNQNSFGHMEKWLTHEEYKYLAEAPNGFIKPWGEKSGPFSLSPAVPESIKFIDLKKNVVSLQKEF